MLCRMPPPRCTSELTPDPKAPVLRRHLHRMESYRGSCGRYALRLGNLLVTLPVVAARLRFMSIAGGLLLACKKQCFFNAAECINVRSRGDPFRPENRCGLSLNRYITGLYILVQIVIQVPSFLGTVIYVNCHMAFMLSSFSTGWPWRCAHKHQGKPLLRERFKPTTGPPRKLPRTQAKYLNV